MPRISAEARSAAVYRAGGKASAPPSELSDGAKKLWRSIVSCKPVSWFDGGSLPILARYCEAMAQAERIEDELRRLVDVTDPVYLKLTQALISLNANCTTMAVKLRLSVQNNIDRKSRKLDEIGTGENDESEVNSAKTLLGGNAAWPGLKIVA